MTFQVTLSVVFCGGCSEHGSNTEEFNVAWTGFNFSHSEIRETQYSSSHIMYVYGTPIGIISFLEKSAFLPLTFRLN